MKQRSAVHEKSYLFALRVVRVIRELREARREFVLCDQLLRAATSIGANAEEANAAQSKKDFTAKMAIGIQRSKGD